MITRLMKIGVVIVIVAFAFTACDSGETFTMTSDEGIAKIKELITTNVDTSKCKIYEVEWSEDGHDRKLENILMQIDVYYIDAGSHDYNLSFRFTDGKFTTDGPKKSDRQSYSYECSTALDLDAINFEYLKRITEGAVSIVQSDEEGKELSLKSAEMFRFRVWPVMLREVDRWNRSEEFCEESKQLEVQFEFNYIDENESTEYEGRFTVTNYYTVSFTANAAGEVSLDD